MSILRVNLRLSVILVAAISLWACESRLDTKISAGKAPASPEADGAGDGSEKAAENSQDPAAAQEATPSAARQRQALYLESFADLPACGAENDTQLVYLFATKQFLSCRGTEWTEVVIDPVSRDGALGQIITSVSEPSGEHCSNSGIKVLTGIDGGAGGATPGDGYLDGDEISKAQYICSGSNATGSLIASMSEPAGSNCAEGGVKIMTGLDNGASGGTAQDNKLEGGEVLSESYVCKGANGADGKNGSNGH